MGADELEALGLEEVGRTERGGAGTQRPQEGDAVLGAFEREQPGSQRGWERLEPETCGRHDGERPLAPDDQARPVVACVVLHESRKPLDDRPVRENDLESRHLGPHRAEPGGERPSRVRRDHAADRGPAAPAVVDRKLEAARADTALDGLEPDSRPGRNLARDGFDGVERVETLETDQHLALARDLPADHACVTSLQAERRAVVRTSPHYIGHLPYVSGSGEHQRPAVEAASQVVLVALGRVSPVEHVLGADGGNQVVAKRHARMRQAASAARIAV